MIRIPRLGHIGVLILLFCVAFPFFGWPAVLWVLFAIPAAVSLWIERSRTTVSEGGLRLRTVFGSRHLDWSQIKGLRIPKRGFVRAHLTDDSEVALPAVSYDRLPLLVAASNGRIPDPFAQPDTEPDLDAPDTEPAADTPDTESAASAPDTGPAASAPDTEPAADAPDTGPAADAPDADGTEPK
ncbi:PH domain-containing protein [Nocardia wallacei]|uniref:PH domain-containing protein n=1 Tax=Nocardia wallacei TaxID=480035 RepID=UPI002453C889|nr:PH domain-containing protein [Nocardia wallacei]